MKPANFILDLLRTYGIKGTSAKNLMSAATLFTYSDNVIRVTLSRLTSRGLIEKVARGYYRLAPGSNPINDFVEEWRLGEERIRPWQGNFITVYAECQPERQIWALDATGFKPLGTNLWARPDNLRRTQASLRAWLVQLGLDETAIVGEGVSFCEGTQHNLLKQYDTEAHLQRYKELDKQLTRSVTRLETLPRQQAMTESFTLGGKALQLLAKDPYLPAELTSTKRRHQLWQKMMRYDEIGRQAWSGEPGSLPSESLRYTA